MVEAVIGQTSGDGEGVFFIVNSRAAVAFALGRVEKAVVAGNALDVLADLILRGFDLLKT